MGTVEATTGRSRQASARARPARRRPPRRCPRRLGLPARPAARQRVRTTTPSRATKPDHHVAIGRTPAFLIVRVIADEVDARRCTRGNRCIAPRSQLASSLSPWIRYPRYARRRGRGSRPVDPSARYDRWPTRRPDVSTFQRSIWPRRRGPCCARTRSWRSCPCLVRRGLVVAATFILLIVVVAGDAPDGDSWTSNPITWVLGFPWLPRGGVRDDLLQRRDRVRRRRASARRDPTLGTPIKGASAGVPLPGDRQRNRSLVLRAIEERGIIGRIVIGLVGLAGPW